MGLVYDVETFEMILEINVYFVVKLL